MLDRLLRCVSGLVLLCLLCSAWGVQADERPNIVFIMADDLGLLDLGVTGSDYYKTPNLDAFAVKSTMFRNAYANCANCAPTRAALMSGMYAPRTGVYTVGSSQRGKASDRLLVPTPNKTELDAKFVTLAEVLKAAGYTTAHMGKWHLGEGETGPLSQGFDINIGGGANGHPGSYFQPYKNVKLADSPKGEYLTDRLTQEAAEFIGKQKHAEKPFFLYLPLYTPHTPIQPLPEFVEKVKGRQKGKLHDHEKYAAFIEGMDHFVGRVLNAIDEHGFADNTIVVFTSDNGGHGTYTDQDPLRGSKGMFYEGGIRVPLFVRYPGVAKHGWISDEPVMLLDFYPTFANIAGAELPEDQPVDGLTLLPLLEDPKHARLDREAIFFHFPAYLQGYAGGEGAEAHRPPWRSTPCGVIRTRQYKLIEYFETGEVELFSMLAYPREKQDLSKKLPEIRDDLLGKLRAWRDEVDAPVPTEKNPKYKGE